MRSAIVAVAVAKDPACVDNLHVDDARHVLAWADAIAERATPRLTLRRQGPANQHSVDVVYRSYGAFVERGPTCSTTATTARE